MLRQLVMLMINSENLQTANQTNSQVQSQMAAEAVIAAPPRYRPTPRCLAQDQCPLHCLAAARQAALKEEDSPNEALDYVVRSHHHSVAAAWQLWRSIAGY